LKEIDALKGDKAKLSATRGAKSASSSLETKKAKIIETERQVSSLISEIDSHLALHEEVAIDAAQVSGAPVTIVDVASEECLKSKLMTQLGDGWLNFVVYSPPNKLLQKYASSEILQILESILDHFDNPTTTELEDANVPLLQLTKASAVIPHLSQETILDTVESLQSLAQILLEKHNGAEIIHKTP
jgi:hypothetical protein